jgi:uridine phosphorylase
VPKPFTLLSDRGFLTITGRYNGTPVSIISIGMGNPNMDFFVREVRECIIGDMVVVRYPYFFCEPDKSFNMRSPRLGSCGALIDIPVGSVVVPKASVAVTRNLDYDFVNGSTEEEPYRISQQVLSSYSLHGIFRTLTVSPGISKRRTPLSGFIFTFLAGTNLYLHSFW